MQNFVYLAKLHEPLAKHDKNLISAAESLSNVFDTDKLTPVAKNS